MYQHDIADVETIWSPVRENVYSDRGLAASSPIILETAVDRCVGGATA